MRITVRGVGERARAERDGQNFANFAAPNNERRTAAPIKWRSPTRERKLTALREDVYMAQPICIRIGLCVFEVAGRMKFTYLCGCENSSGLMGGALRRTPFWASQMRK